MDGICQCERNALDGGGATTGGGNFDTLLVTGNSQLGDSVGDTLLVNATSTFNNNVVCNGNTQLGNAAGDTLTVNATSIFNNNAAFNGIVQLGNAVTDILYVYPQPTYINGSGVLTRSTANATLVPTGVNFFTMAPSIPNYVNQITVCFSNITTTSTTARPTLDFYGTAKSNTNLLGIIANSAGNIVWDNDEIYLKGTNWSLTSIVQGTMVFTRMGTVGTDTMWSITCAIDTNIGSGSIITLGTGTVNVMLKCGSTATFTGGRYNVCYL